MLVLNKSVIIKQVMMGHNSTPYILYQARNVQSPHLAAHLSHLCHRSGSKEVENNVHKLAALQTFTSENAIMWKIASMGGIYFASWN